MPERYGASMMLMRTKRTIELKNSHRKVRRTTSRTSCDCAGSVTRLSTTPHSCVCDCSSNLYAPARLLQVHRIAKNEA